MGADLPVSRRDIGSKVGMAAPCDGYFLLFQVLAISKGEVMKESGPGKSWTRHRVLIVLDKTFRI